MQAYARNTPSSRLTTDWLTAKITVTQPLFRKIASHSLILNHVEAFLAKSHNRGMRPFTTDLSLASDLRYTRDWLVSWLMTQSRITCGWEIIGINCRPMMVFVIWKLAYVSYWWSRAWVWRTRASSISTDLSQDSDWLGTACTHIKAIGGQTQPQTRDMVVNTSHFGL